MLERPSRPPFQKRDHLPQGGGGFRYPTYPKDDDEDPCWKGGVSRASCMFGIVPTGKNEPSTVFVMPPTNIIMSTGTNNDVSTVFVIPTTITEPAVTPEPTSGDDEKGDPMAT